VLPGRRRGSPTACLQNHRPALLHGGRSSGHRLGVSQQTLRNWGKRVAIDRRESDDGLTSAERAELGELRKRVRRLEQERDILKRATALFARETETR
jgi:transposase-like protein